MLRFVSPCSGVACHSEPIRQNDCMPDTHLRGGDGPACFSGRCASTERHTHRRRQVFCAAAQTGQTAAPPQSFAGIPLDKAPSASEEPMQVTFREVSTWSLWIWFELHKPASPEDMELLETVLSSWFMLGRLGGFNAMNLQALYQGDQDTSFMQYDQDQCSTAMQALFHDMGSLERKDSWCRCWFNLGTADELALDVLINSLSTFSKENVGIKQLIIGGVNEDWPVAAEEASK